MNSLRAVESWPAENVSVGLASVDGPISTFGDRSREYRWASLTKPVTALACLVAAEEGTIDLDEPAGPPGSTFRHLLAHASGLPPGLGAQPADPSAPGRRTGGSSPIARPGDRRIYSDHGFDVLGAALAEHAEMTFGDYLREAVLRPLGIGARYDGRPGSGLHGSLDDLLAVARELLAPTLVSAETLAEATTVAFPGLAGVLPGFGRQEPNDWGLGFELRDRKQPHWTGARNSERTFGHFGRSGTFLWVDPEPGVALACLTDLEFGKWATEAWPQLSDAVLSELDR
ncbi:MAG TPA: serine hydrolase domain-containing protein [Gaiellaceae bacterium]|nr:serine hydrolase domain-containing protein [Gaiellaceae bacterium]